LARRPESKQNQQQNQHAHRSTCTLFTRLNPHAPPTLRVSGRLGSHRADSSVRRQRHSGRGCQGNADWEAVMKTVVWVGHNL
jgi:hypothetical protein